MEPGRVTLTIDGQTLLIDRREEAEEPETDDDDLPEDVGDEVPG